MTIYILGDKTHEILDDNSLDNMISDLAQVLCNVHFLAKRRHNQVSWLFGRMEDDAPLPPKHDHDDWSSWGKKCLANYKALLIVAKTCCIEWSYRFSDGGFMNGNFIYHGKIKEHKHHNVIAWCELNTPDLPMLEFTPWPLVMPTIYIQLVYKLSHPYIVVEDSIFKSYRSYYYARLKSLFVKCKRCRDNESDYLNPKFCDDIDYYCGFCHSTGYTLPSLSWTRRERPKFLGDL